MQLSKPVLPRRSKAAEAARAPHSRTDQPAEELEAELLEELAQDADLPSLAVPKQGRRAEFVPAHSVPGGPGKDGPSRGGQLPRSTPAEHASLEHDPILFVSHSQGPLDALLEPLPDEPLPEALVDDDEGVESDAGESIEQEETMPCMRVRLAPRRSMRRVLYILTLGLSLVLVLLAARSWYPLESSETWKISLSVVQEKLRGYLGR